MSENLLNYFYWIKDNYVELIVSLSLLIPALQAIARFTPTKTDDGFLEKIGEKLTALMDMLRIPNVKRNPGSIMPSGLHNAEEKKETP